MLFLYWDLTLSNTCSRWKRMNKLFVFLQRYKTFITFTTLEFNSLDFQFFIIFLLIINTFIRLYSLLPLIYILLPTLFMGIICLGYVFIVFVTCPSWIYFSKLMRWCDFWLSFSQVWSFLLSRCFLWQDVDLYVSLIISVA